MTGERRTGEDQREPILGVGDVSNHTIDPGVGSRYEWLLNQSRASSKTHTPWCLYGEMTLIAFMQFSPSRCRGRLFRPNCNRGCDGSCDFLNRPFVFSARNNGETISLCMAPSGAAVNGCPVKKVAFMSFGAILRFDEICDHWELIMFCAPAQGWQRKYHDLARSAQSRQ